MKKRLFRQVCALLALALCLCCLSCSTGENGNNDGKSDEETKEKEPIHNIAFTELGVPTEEKYPTGERARLAWDMALHGGKIYIGSGDYGKNRGPAQISCYDPTTGAWEAFATVPDEEVDRFCVLSGKLCAPGIDPREGDWSLGNYYVLEDGAWTVKRTIPGGIHNFDMIEYHGSLFAGLGVSAGGYPVAVSSDGGQTFSSVPFFKKDGSPVHTSGYTQVRTYDFFLLGDTLYATLTLDSVYELYKYSEARASFYYVGDMKEQMHFFYYKLNPLGEKVTFDDSLYLATGNLYETPDFHNISPIVLEEGAMTTDLFVDGDTLYVLLSSNIEEGKYKTAVYALESGKATFREVFDFVYDVPSVSMVVSGEDFYIGMGYKSIESLKNGMLLHVSVDK